MAAMSERFTIPPTDPEDMALLHDYPALATLACAERYIGEHIG